jgi:hypothetical protein
MFVQLLYRRARSFTLDCQKLIHRAKFNQHAGARRAPEGRSPCQDFPGSCWDQPRQSRWCLARSRSRHLKLRPRYRSSEDCPGSCPTVVSARTTAATGEVTTRRGTTGVPKKETPRKTIPGKATTRATSPTACNFQVMDRKPPRPTRNLPALLRQPHRLLRRRPDSRAATYRRSRQRSNEARREREFSLLLAACCTLR